MDRTASRRLAPHLAGVALLGPMLALVVVYPFLPGQHDRLAVPLSTMAQVFGVIGLVLVPGGVLWLVRPAWTFALAAWSTLAATCVALVLALFATLSVGNAFGVLTLGAWMLALFRMVPAVARLKRESAWSIHPAPLYLVCLPTIVLATQLLLMDSLTRRSRDRAMTNAAELIADIDRTRQDRGRYPVSLEAQHADYRVGVVGVDRYRYLPADDSYNLSFEQPRFLLDRFGTREWVVYNPGGNHRMYSHAAWLLESEGQGPQGWYAAGDTGRTHWRYFLFD